MQPPREIRGYRLSVSDIAASYPMDRINKIPLDKLDADWRLAQTNIWPVSVFARSSVRKLLQTYARSGSVEPARDIAGLSRVLELRNEIEASPLAGCPAFSGINTGSDRLQTWCGQALR